MTPPLKSGAPVMWLQLLLVGALASIVLILAQTYGAVSTNRALVEGALREYAGFAAWSYRERLITALRGVVDEALGPVNHGDGFHTQPDYPSAVIYAHNLPWDSTCMCHHLTRGPLPDRILAFSLGSDTVSVGLNRSSGSHDGWLVDDTTGAGDVPGALNPASRESHMINRALSDAARRQDSSPWGYRVFSAGWTEEPRLAAVRAMKTQWGDTIVYAVDYDSAAVHALLHGVLNTSDLLPASLLKGRKGSDILQIAVSDARGTTLFASNAPAAWTRETRTTRRERGELDATEEMPESYGGFRIRTRLDPMVAEMFLIGGVPRSRVPILLILLALALGLTVLAAVQLRREVRFASDRANFVANVSHELRTPLAQVRLVVDTLRRGRTPDEKDREYALGVADREVMRLQHLVEGVLRFARGKQGRKSGRDQAIDLAAHARTVVDEFRPLADGRHATIDVIAPAPVPAAIEPNALRQALLNLLDNALKYGPDGGHIEVAVSGGADGVQLAVSDAGPGVALAERERIWRPFERSSAASAGAVGGSGIGLTIVRMIAEEHGGGAHVEPRRGGGSRFVIELPSPRT